MLVFCRGQDRPQHAQSSLLMHPQTHPSGELPMAELVAWLSIL